MAEIATHFPPQTYSSSFFINSLGDDEKNGSVDVELLSGEPHHHVPLFDCLITTMFSFILSLFFLLFCELASQECLTPPIPRTRSFKSILQYQGNTKPFDFTKSAWEGNSLEFSFDALRSLQKNLFFTYDSAHIYEMNLSNKQIDEIDEGAFNSLDCLRKLILKSNNLTNLQSPKVFDGLKSIEELDLSANSLTYLPDLVFSEMETLKILNLEANQLRRIEVLAFKSLNRLEFLNLGANRLNALLGNVFLPLVNLSRLNLAGNLLSEIEAEKLHGLAKLKSLSLASNNLNHFDPNYDFSFRNLEFLNLSGNGLTMLNTFGIMQHIPKLNLIDLNGNVWICKDLVEIFGRLHDLKIQHVEGVVFDKNKRVMNYEGVACENYPRPISGASTTEAIIARQTEDLGNVTAPKKYFYEVMMKYKKIEHGNDEMLSSLRYIQDMTVFMFVILMLFIIVQVMVKVECRRIFSRRNQNGNLYFDNSNIESLRLLHR